MLYHIFYTHRQFRRLPNGHLNVAAFNRLAAIVGAFTKHMCDTVTNAVPQTSDVRDEYQNLCRRMQSCTLLTDNGTLLKCVCAGVWVCVGS